MAILNNNAIVGASGQSTGGAFQIQRSLRFNSADSAYLTRTFASAGNKTKWTWSCWLKRSILSTDQGIMSAGITLNQYWLLQWRNDNKIQIDQYNSPNSSDFAIETAAVYRDVSAWYHLVITTDTSLATAADRVKIYINNVQQSITAVTNYIGQNKETLVNTANAHEIGRRNYNPDGYHNGYMTEINFIDGQALTPSSFGETDTDTGVWKPKAYSGSYGTNGFYLKFADNSGTTSTTLGKDSSGNGNNWTPNNFSVTAGVGNDSLVDTPTPYGTDTGAGGEVRGNYCTMNALDCAGTITLSNGNLNAAVASGSASKNVRSTIFPTTGKWYWETTVNSLAGNVWVGIATAAIALDSGAALDQTGGFSYGSNGNFYRGGTSDTTPNTYTANDVIGCAWDVDARSIQFYKNGSSEGTLSSLTAATYSPAFTVTSGSDSISVNFGQRPFAYTAPSGYKALCTTNLPTPTIGATASTQAGKYFDTVIWSANGSGAVDRTITSSFQPDMIWSKTRSAAYHNNIFDAVRGFGSNNSLVTDQSWSEGTASGGRIKSVASNSFTWEAGGSSAEWYNQSSNTYVSWYWKANGAGSSNTQGSITSTVSANTTSGFSIATFTIQTSGSATVGHGLGVAPSLILVKTRNLTFQWDVYHESIGKDAYLVLNSTATQVTGATTVWNSTAPTSTVFSLGSAWASAAPGNTAVAYCFAPVAGYSAFGSYTGNGSSDGIFLYLGFRPRFILIKRINTAEDWVVVDTSRSPINVTNLYLLPSSAAAEGTTTLYDFVSNGIKFRGNSQNESGSTYIYAAFAEFPFKYTLAR